MIFFGILDHEWQDILYFYPSREAAEAELTKILEDEPEWIDKLEVVLVDFTGPEVTVQPASRQARGR